MNTKLSDLLSSLPQDEPESGLLDSAEAQEQLKAIFADLAYKRVPVHSLHRIWTIGELSTQITLAYTALWVRGLFADTKKKEQQRNETNIRVALKMVHRLGYLRGAAIKLGQAFGSLPELLPDQVVSTLDMLHAQAPPMHYSLIREVVLAELGKEPTELFASFDKEPFAAASIGQVHRATLKSGEDVAVKIQYPGIGRAIQADLRNVTALVFPTRLTRGGESIRGQIDAMKQMLAEEMDYAHEAQNAREARALFKEADGVVVPKIFDEYSTSRVLTMEFIPGKNVSEFLAGNPSQGERDALGTKINLVAERMLYARINYSDPHSGNYIAMNDGRLGLVDFGCLQRIAPEDFKWMDNGDRFLDGKITVLESLRETGSYTEKELADENFIGPLLRHYDWFLEPIAKKGTFDFGDPEPFRRMIENLKVMVEKVYPSPPMYLYMYRTIFGLRVLCYRLKCRVDLGALRAQERKPWV